MGDAAGELADGVELLRLLQLALGVAPGGNVVIDQRRAADGAGCVAQRTAGDHEMLTGCAVGRPQHDFLLVERLAAQHLRRRHFARRSAG